MLYLYMYISNEHILRMDKTHAVHSVQIRKGLKRKIEKRIYINFITVNESFLLYIDTYISNKVFKLFLILNESQQKRIPLRNNNVYITIFIFWWVKKFLHTVSFWNNTLSKYQQIYIKWKFVFALKSINRSKIDLEDTFNLEFIISWMLLK